MSNSIWVKRDFEQKAIDAIRESRGEGYINFYRGFIVTNSKNPPPEGNPPVHFELEVDGIMYSVYVKNR